MSPSSTSTRAPPGTARSPSNAMSARYPRMAASFTRGRAAGAGPSVRRAGGVGSVALDDRESGPARGGRGLGRERRGSAPERRAERLVVAPVAEPGLVRPEVAGLHGALDRGPDGQQGAL